MRKLLFISLLFFSVSTLFSQSDFVTYLDAKWTFCEKPSDEETHTLYDLGLRCIKQRQNLGSAVQIFNDLIQKDSTFCDAYFWTGYAYRMSNMNKEAVTYYYVADSLAENKSIIFKQNLATASMLAGYPELARKKYEEIVTHFPESPEGHYGIALTSTMLGDYENGLINIDIAIRRYYTEQKDALLIKAVLLTLTERHERALPLYEQVQVVYRGDDNFHGNYALSLYEVARKNKDDKMMKLAKKHYKKVKNKEELTPYMRSLFEE